MTPVEALNEIIRLDAALPTTRTPTGEIVNLARAHLGRAGEVARSALATYKSEAGLSEESVARALAAWWHMAKFGSAFDEAAERTVEQWVEARWKDYRQDAMFIIDRLAPQGEKE